MVDDVDNVYFKRLLDLVPPHFYFNEEAKDLIRNKGELSYASPPSPNIMNYRWKLLQVALHTI